MFRCIKNIFKKKSNPQIAISPTSTLSQLTIDDVAEYSLKNLYTTCKVVDVYDGDTCKIILVKDNTFIRFTCRLSFIDTPEMKPLKSKPNREMEIKEAMRSRNRLIQLATNCKINIDELSTKAQIKELIKTNNKVVAVRCYDFDKYGRLLVEIFDNGISVNKALLNEGLAKPYDGGRKEEFVY